MTAMLAVRLNARTLDDPQHARRHALLRLLARLELVPERSLHALLAPSLSRRHYRRILAQLHQERLIWRHPVDASRVPGALGAANGAPPPRRPLLYGLTDAGRAWLAATGAEPDPAVLARAVVRPWQQPELKLAQLAHDLLVVAWCSGALIGLQRIPTLQAVEVVMEYVTATSATGQPLQRVDALVRLQLAPPAGPPPRPAGDPPALPWGWAAPGAPGLLAWALEIDRGTEPLRTLLGKAVMYRDLTVSGHYAATLGCPLLPVVITPTVRRAAQIAREWVAAWPGGRGIVAPFDRLAEPLGGILWGRYKTLGCNPARDATLWEDLGRAPPPGPPRAADRGTPWT